MQTKGPKKGGYNQGTTSSREKRRGVHLAPCRVRGVAPCRVTVAYGGRRTVGGATGTTTETREGVGGPTPEWKRGTTGERVASPLRAKRCVCKALWGTRVGGLEEGCETDFAFESWGAAAGETRSGGLETKKTPWGFVSPSRPGACGSTDPQSLSFLFSDRCDDA
jgi:hypothetical protein